MPVGHNPRMLSEIDSDFISIDLYKFLDLYTKKPVKTNFKFTNSTRINVDYPSYMSDLNTLVDKTPIDTLSWYLVWRVIFSYGTVLDEQMWLWMKQLDGIVNGVHYSPEIAKEKRWEECIAIVENNLGTSIARYFVQKEFQSKEAAADVMRSVIATFSERAQKSEWLDPPTREKLLAKLSLLRQKIGYPVHPDLRNATKLLEYFNLNTEKSRYAENMVSISQWSISKDLNKLQTKMHDDDWSLPPTSANAYYVSCY